MGRKGESIYKRRDGRYEGRYIKEYQNGHAIYGYVYAKTYSECKRKKNILIKNTTEVNNMKNINSSLNDLISVWLSTKKYIKKSTYTRYYNLIEEHIKSDIGKLNINSINSKIVNDYIIYKLENGRIDKKGGLSKNTVYDIANILKQVFKENKIDIDIMKIQKKTGTGKSLYKEEEKELIKELNSTNSEVALGILLSLMLGLRESEVCGIKWKDIDIKNKVIYINRIVSRVKVFDGKHKTKLIISTPKTESSKRILPIPDKLYEKLIKFDKNPDFFLLTSSYKFMDPRTYYNKYKKILNDLNIKHSYHDLRHTFATNCINLGIDSKSLMELLGHSNITTTMNIYIHPTMDMKRSFVNKL